MTVTFHDLTSLADATKIGQFLFAVALPKVIKGRNESAAVLGIFTNKTLPMLTNLETLPQEKMPETATVAFHGLTSLADVTKLGQFLFAVALPKGIKERNEHVAVLGIFTNKDLPMLTNLETLPQEKMPETATVAFHGLTSSADVTKLGQFLFAVALPKGVKERNESVAVLGIFTNKTLPM